MDFRVLFSDFYKNKCIGQVKIYEHLIYGLLLIVLGSKDKVERNVEIF